MFNHDILPDAPISFKFAVQLPEAAIPHVLSASFGDKPNIPNRIMVFIGKNGTGKTWMMGRLAASLSGDEVNVGEFEPRRPSFSRVVGMSYSAFDQFNKPEDRSFSYRYCGIYDEEGNLTKPEQLYKRAKLSLSAIKEIKRLKDWRDTLKPLLGDDVMEVVERYLLTEEGAKNRNNPRLSSGQLVLLTTMTEMLASIEKDSLVLFDEPELHLHPNAIATLLFVVHKLLRKFNSYAIIATHSPLILQQIPSPYVRVFNRFGNATLIRSLTSVQSFGENLSILTQEIFQVSNSPSLYKDWFRMLLKKMSAEDVLSLFSEELGFNAKSILVNLDPDA